jgi:hypothetical protein
MLTQRLAHALALATEAHDGQKRKGTAIPYIAHPMAVAAITLEHGADEDQAIAALLHDAVEDGGAHSAPRIRAAFSDRVADIVAGCTDGVPDARGRKEDWRIRKTPSGITTRWLLCTSSAAHRYPGRCARPSTACTNWRAQHDGAQSQKRCIRLRVPGRLDGDAQDR